MIKVGLLEFNKTIWPSLERTREFYINTLSSRFKAAPVEISQEGEIAQVPDAIVNFLGDAGWQFQNHPDCPLIFGMHGGAILNQPFLRTHLQRLKTSDVLLVNCQSDVAILQHMFSGPAPFCCCLPLPVDTGCFNAVPRETARKKLPLQDADVVLGFVCRLLPQKNLHRFLAFLQELKASLYPKRVKGIIIGKYWVDYPILNYETTTYPDYIQTLIKKSGLQQDLLYFPGNLTNEDLATCYNAMDLLIHPTNSIDENFGYAPVEAMMCGTPVIGAGYGGLKDTVISEETGFLMPTWVTDAGIRMDIQSGISFAAALLTDTTRYQQMCAAAQQHAQNYTTARCANILCNAITTAIKSHRLHVPVNVVLAASPPCPTENSYLPRLKDPWEHYKPQVSYYVSQTIQRLQMHHQVYLAAAVRDLDEEQLTLDDPAWPAVYRLSKLQQRIALQCKKPATVQELVQEHAVDITEIENLVNIGLFCYSAPAPC
jgi:glycosyltransferase involved in cell wall biosynthesis